MKAQCYQTPLVKVHTELGYDFYLLTSCGDREAVYNIVPQGSTAPHGGYRQEYIEDVKGVKFPDRYQRNRK